MPVIKTSEMQRIEGRDAAGRPIDAILRALYVDEGMTLEEVGERLAAPGDAPYTKGAIRDWLARCDIPTRRPGQRGKAAVA